MRNIRIQLLIACLTFVFLGKSTPVFAIFGFGTANWCIEDPAKPPCKGMRGECVKNADGTQGGFVSTDALISPISVPRFTQICAGAVIGEGVILGNHVVIGENVRIEDKSEIGDHVHIGNHVEVGSRATIEGKTSIDPFSRLGEGVRVGSGVSIGPFSTLEKEVTIQNQVQIHENVYLGYRSKVDFKTIVRQGAHLGSRARVKQNSKIGENYVVGNFEKVAENSNLLLPEKQFTLPPSKSRILNRAVPLNPKVFELRLKASENLDKRLSKNYISSEVFNLNSDFLKAQKVIEKAKSLPVPQGHYRLNFDYISEDPFLAAHTTDIHQIIPDPFDQKEYHQVAKSLKLIPGLRTELSQIERVFQTIEENQGKNPDDLLSKTKITTQKRVLRSFRHALDQKEKKIEGPTIKDPVEEFGLLLGQNAERCIDGLQDGITDIEERYFGENRAKEPGDLISRVLTDYRMEFIKKHGDLDPNDEFRTTVAQVLRQRMLYSLGIRGSEAEVRYPRFANPASKVLQPASVMERFLLGGDYHLEDGPIVHFDPYNVDKMVSLLQEARERAAVDKTGRGPLHPFAPGQKVKNSLLEEFRKQDPALNEAYIDFFTDMDEPNPFFEKAAPGQHESNFRLKDAFWLYVLEKNGYIQRPGPVDPALDQKNK